MSSGSLLFERASSPPCGIEKGLWEKSIFFSSSFHSYIGKSTIQQNSKRFLIDELELAADPGARLAGELVELVRLAGDEEHRVADPERRAGGGSPRCARRRCSWRSGRRRPPRPSRRRCSRGPAGPRACAQPFMRSQKARLPPLGAGMAQTSTLRSSAIMPAKTLKPEPRKCSVTSCMLDRIAQVGLVGAVFADRLAVGDARELRRHRLALGELLEHPAQHRLDGGEDVLLRDEAHLDVELVELAGRAVGARVLVAEAGRDLEIAVEARRS